MIERFKGQKPDEKIEFLVRKHWIIDIRVFLKVLVGGIIPVIILVGLIIAYWPEFFTSTGRKVVTLVFLLWLLFLNLWLYIEWLNQELDLVIVTNERLISFDQISFMRRSICETNLSQIQDVKGFVPGFLGNLLDYGDLEAQTAAERITFRIKDVSHPLKMARRILDVRDVYLKKGGGKSTI